MLRSQQQTCRLLVDCCDWRRRQEVETQHSNLTLNCMVCCWCAAVRLAQCSSHAALQEESPSWRDPHASQDAGKCRTPAYPSTAAISSIAASWQMHPP